MILQANCKINLGLDVLRRREDGFHDLETVMLPVRELFDVVEVRRRGDNELRFRQRGLTVDCPAEENVCVKAFRLMQRRYGVGGVEITLDKCVPFGAGLGGGSADATMVLRALNELFALRLSEDVLIERAAELGSDTSFFVRNSPQFCTGARRTDGAGGTAARRVAARAGEARRRGLYSRSLCRRAAGRTGEAPARTAAKPRCHVARVREERFRALRIRPSSPVGPHQGGSAEAGGALCRHVRERIDPLWPFRGREALYPPFDGLFVHSEQL